MSSVAAISSPLTVPGSTNSTTNPANLYQAIPGLSNLLGTATGNIGNLLNGLGSPSYAQTTSAFAGAGAGQPGAGNALGTFVGNRGADLYNLQGQQNQQTGLSDLMSLIGTSSGNLAPSASQNQQNSQFYSNLGQQGSEFQQSLAEQQFNDQVNALIGLSNSGIGGTGGAGGFGGGLTSVPGNVASTPDASLYGGSNTNLASLLSQLPGSFQTVGTLPNTNQSSNGSLNSLIQNIISAGGVAPYGSVNGDPVVGNNPYGGFSLLY